MSNVLGLVISLLAAAPPVAVAQGAKPAQGAALEHGAKIVDDAFTKAFVDNDLAAVVALYAPGAKLYPPDAMEKTREGIRESFAAFLGSNTVKAFKVLDATYETSGALSVGWGTFSLTTAPKKGGNPMQIEGRFTSVAKKIGGKWLYIADHASFVPPAPPAPQSPPLPAPPQVPKPASMPGGERR